MQDFNQEHKIQTQLTNGLCSNWKQMRCIEIQTPTMSAMNPSKTMPCMPLFEGPQRKIERLIVLCGKRKCETIQATSAHTFN